MNAAVFREVGVIETQARDIPEPGVGEVVIRVAVCGICGTDQHIYHGKPGSATVVPPRILGHELSGTVVAVGHGVDLLTGDRVSVDPNIYCGKCRYCRRGTVHLCERLQAIGVTRDGGMAEYVIVPAANCFRMQDDMSFEQGAMIEPLGCCVHGISQLNLTPGTSAIVIGGGYIGLLMVQLLRLYGCHPVVVSELDDSKHALARELGATATYSPATTDLAGVAGELPGGGFDVVIECVGRADSMQTATLVAGKGGQVLLFGVADPTTEIGLRPFDVFSKELQIKGSFINPNTHEIAMSLVTQGRVDVVKAISHRFTLDNLPEAMSNYPNLRVTKGIVIIE